MYVVHTASHLHQVEVLHPPALLATQMIGSHLAQRYVFVW